ncbi:type II toxin-antitoxin system VapC family toxin [Candidatus Woesearchaeota archaeon]|nr:type II toxin-antitoxin system VapC family toxin [Candidatus Woesearchaeota archaeon]
MMLLDTNIFVDHLRNFPPAIHFFDSLGQEEVFFSVVTESELLAGKANNDEVKREKLLHFLHRCMKLPLTDQIATLAGDLARQYGLEIPDAVIAATALSKNLELITRNLSDFKKIKGLRVRAPY